MGGHDSDERPGGTVMEYCAAPLQLVSNKICRFLGIDRKRVQMPLRSVRGFSDQLVTLGYSGFEQMIENLATDR
jgi:hypothetical protein